jgi:hypothetical protein
MTTRAVKRDGTEDESINRIELKERWGGRERVERERWEEEKGSRGGGKEKTKGDDGIHTKRVWGIRMYGIGIVITRTQLELPHHFISVITCSYTLQTLPHGGCGG